MCFAVDHVDGDHTIDRPAQYDFWRDVPAAVLGRPAAVLPLAEPAHPGDQPSGRSPRTRTTTRSPVEADQRVNPGDGNLWTFRRIAARRNCSADGAYASDICLVNWPMIDYFEAPVIDVPDAGARTSQRPASCPGRCCTGCRPRRRAPTAAPASPGCGCAATSPAARTGWPRRRTSGSPGGSAPSTPSSSRTCRWPCAATRARSRYPDSVGVGMYRIDLHPSTGGDNYIDVGVVPVRDPARRADPAADGEPAAGRQEHRHHPHHQRLATGCTRSSGTSARSPARSPPTAWTTRRPPRARSATPRRCWPTSRHRLTRDGVELRWPDVSGY